MEGFSKVYGEFSGLTSGLWTLNFPSRSHTAAEMKAYVELKRRALSEKRPSYSPILETLSTLNPNSEQCEALNTPPDNSEQQKRSPPG